MSPVEICGILKCSVMNVACVPLPAPGAPNKMIRITFFLEIFMLIADG
jgi:hypothetical protein